jgi:hypothetical protein
VAQKKKVRVREKRVGRLVSTSRMETTERMTRSRG